MDEFSFVNTDTGAWKFLVRASFYVSLTLTILGILALSGDLWAKGYMIMGLLWTIYSAFAYAKSVRDAHEVQRRLHELQENRTDMMLKEFS